MPKKLTIEEMRILAAAKGGVCLSGAYSGKNVKLQWRCAQGHEWWSTPHHIKNNGSWCPHCAHKVPLTIEDARSVAAERGGSCLSERVVSGSKLRWSCAKGHEWDAHIGAIRNSGTWCPHCAGKHRTIEEMAALASARGGVCLSPAYLHNSALEWQCAAGHVWSAIPARLMCGEWCPVCAGRRRTIEEMRTLAKARGGHCLSDKYAGTMLNLKWRCAKGHEWEAAPMNVLHKDSWCPECKANKRERQCRQVFEAAFGVKFPKTRPLWLINSKGNRMELDGYSTELGVAFEYQGFQHYKKTYYHTDEQFEWQLQRDAEKRALCAANGVMLVEVPWDTPDLAMFVRTVAKITLNRNG